MSAEYFVIGILFSLLLASHIYWPIVFFRFLDRYSSRNFGEYAQSKALMNRQPEASLQSPPEDVVDPLAVMHAEAVNRLFT